MHLPSDQHEESSYIIFKKNGDIFARNGDSGNIEFSGTDAATVIEDVLNTGSHIRVFIRNGTYDIDSKITTNENGHYIQGEDKRGTILNATSAMDYIFDFSEPTVGFRYNRGVFRDFHLNLNTNARGGISVETTYTGAHVMNNHFINLRVSNPNTTGTLEGINTGRGEEDYFENVVIEFPTSVGTGIYCHPVNGDFTMVKNYSHAARAYDIRCQAGAMISPIGVGDNEPLYIGGVGHSLTILDPYLDLSSGTGNVVNTHGTNGIGRLNLKGGLINTQGGQTALNITSTGHDRTVIDGTKCQTRDGVAADLLNVPNGEVHLRSPSLRNNLSRGTYTPPPSHEEQHALIRGNNGVVTGDAGSSYADFDGTAFKFNPAYTPVEKITNVTWTTFWNPNTTSGSIKLRNKTDGVDVAVSEPGATGLRTDDFDLTSTFKGYTNAKNLKILNHGDGSTAPAVYRSILKIALSEEEP